jgi:TonB family protein
MWRPAPAATLPIFLLLLLSSAWVTPQAQEASENARKIIVHVDPQYPAVAHNMRIFGVVKIEVVVLPNGTVKSIAIKGGHPLLVQAAQNAVREWKWAPAAHETREELEIHFNPE